jgi:hypothetical protein
MKFRKWDPKTIITTTKCILDFEQFENESLKLVTVK